MKKILLFILITSTLQLFSQNPSDRDPDYNPFNLPLNHYFIGKGIRKVLTQSDNRMIVLEPGSDKLIRLENNLLDTSFNVFFNAIDRVNDFCILPNDKIIVVGSFTSCNGVPKNRIVRLNSDGSIDPTFDIGTGYTGGNLLRVQPTLNNGIIVNGLGSTYNGTPITNDLFRINSNGSLDNSFSNNYTNINLFKVQSNGKIIVRFLNFNIQRLNIDGTVDTTFNSGAINSGESITQILIEPNDKILLVGNFEYYGISPLKNIARLNSNGTIDQTFTGSNINSRITDIVRQVDGKYIITGDFFNISSVNVSQLARLNSDGTLDNTAFYGFTQSASIPSYLHKQQDEKIIIYTQTEVSKIYQNELAINVVRTNLDGSIDSNFRNYCKGFYPFGPRDIILRENGKYLASINQFENTHCTFNGTRISRILQLNPDWTIDEEFSQTIGANFTDGSPFKIRELNDGKLIIVGSFKYTYQSTNYYNFLILNPDGSVVYGPTSPTIGTIDFDLLEDGKILVVGSFSSIGFGSANGIARLLPNGIKDNTFNYTGNISNKHKIRQLQNGKVVYIGSNSNRLYKLNNDGSADNSFSNNLISCEDIEVHPDGKILVLSSNNLFKLNDNGSNDSSFNFSNPMSSFNVQPNGKILIGTGSVVYRINENGSIDNDFENIIVNDYIENITTLKNGKIFVSGSFDIVNNIWEGGGVMLLGEEYFFLRGQNKFDNNLNGCDENDSNFRNLKYEILNGNQTNYHIANSSGNYSIGFSEGSYTITPKIENPSYFTIVPETIEVNFPEQLSPETQNFCIIPNGNHQDIEIVIIPVFVARPGFDCNYKILYKNKGNQTVSGQVAINFPENVMTLISSSPLYDSMSENQLIWNYTNLQPFENGIIDLIYNLNAPTDNPPLNGGETITISANITPEINDEFPNDNNFILNQAVINSFDPNDKTCLEGKIVTPEIIGQFVHYIIRFENTGNGEAINITVKDIIDTSKFDLASLIPISSSHEFYTDIVNNTVSFIFKNINLPYLDETNDGYIAFKIRLNDNLTIGDNFSNQAEIYFDYNYPIITNNEITVIELLSLDNNQYNETINLYPNPARDYFIINSDEPINKIEIYSTNGQLLQTIINLSKDKIDVSHLTSGLYFIKINNSKTIKLLKQ